jgi:hypothetical protein
MGRRQDLARRQGQTLRGRGARLDRSTQLDSEPSRARQHGSDLGRPRGVQRAATPLPRTGCRNQRGQRMAASELGDFVGSQRSQRRTENVDTVGVRSPILRSPTLGGPGASTRLRCRLGPHWGLTSVGCVGCVRFARGPGWATRISWTHSGTDSGRAGPAGRGEAGAQVGRVRVADRAAVCPASAIRRRLGTPSGWQWGETGVVSARACRLHRRLLVLPTSAGQR